MGGCARDLAEAKGFIDPPGYRRHRPEETLLYRIVAEHYPALCAQRAAEDRPLPGYVQREFEAYLRCGRLEYGFLRVRCEGCHAEKLVAFSFKGRGFCPSCGGRRMTETAACLVDDILPREPVRQWVLSLPFALRYLLATWPEEVTRVLGIVYRAISGHLIKQAGLNRASAATGAVTLIQRFGSTLNLNIHFHMLLPDGVYRKGAADTAARFVPVPPPSAEQLARLVRPIAERIGRSLERAGLLTRDMDNAYLALDPSEEAPINSLLGHSITYRIATGPREGQKVFTLQTLPADPAASRKGVAESAGFSLHAGVRANSRERDKLEHLARYVSRPPIAIKRLALTDLGHVRYTLKRPYADGTTHIIFEPMDFIARLVALVPKPKAHLTRYHGVFAPNSALRAQVVTRPAADHAAASSATTNQYSRRAMTWAQRLKRVFAIQIHRCARCGGRLRVIASIEQAPVVKRILDHLACTKGAVDLAHASRAPPTGELPF